MLFWRSPMKAPRNPDSPEILALLIQYIYETDPDFEEALDKVLFQEPSNSHQSKDKKKRKKSKFTLKRLIKKQAKMQAKKRPK